MTRTAFVLGGTGQIGAPAAARLAEAGWQVTAGARRPPPRPSTVRFQQVDRTEPGALARALGDGADLLVDVVAYSRADAEQLLALRSQIGRIVAISSVSVYRDAVGRTLDEATGPESFPELPVPTDEDQPTVEPGESTYSRRKVAMERTLLDAGDPPVTIIRPCAVHGPGSPGVREWYFVKRALDGRRVVVLGDGGRSRFHTTSVANLAELVRLAAESPGSRVLNCGDPDPPTVLEIGRAIAMFMECCWVEVLLPAPTAWDDIGDTPWSAPKPFVVSTARAEALGYRPVTSYEVAVQETCAWLAVNAVESNGTYSLPGMHERMSAFFDYAREDALVAALS